MELINKIRKKFKIREDRLKNRSAFAVGTGRCGTKFVAELMEHENAVSSIHERNPLNETFHRYHKWYNLPVDHEGFLHVKEAEIIADLNRADFSFESSAFVSLSIQELHERFQSKFLLLVRSPDKVVNSYVRKGYYLNKTVRANPDLALGYQDCAEFHHFLGRVVPTGEDFSQWNELTRVGKIAWFWNAINEAVLLQFEDIPQTHKMIVKLEDLDFRQYQEITRFVGFNSELKQELFESVVQKKPNALSGVPSKDDWTSQEYDQFCEKVAPMANKFGYEV